MSLYTLSKPKLYQIFTLMRRKSQKGAKAGQFVVHLFFFVPSGTNETGSIPPPAAFPHPIISGFTPKS